MGEGMRFKIDKEVMISQMNKVLSAKGRAPITEEQRKSFSDIEVEMSIPDSTVVEDIEFTKTLAEMYLNIVYSMASMIFTNKDVEFMNALQIFVSQWLMEIMSIDKVLTPEVNA
jgi:hypothetical protein